MINVDGFHVVESPADASEFEVYCKVHVAAERMYRNEGSDVYRCVEVPCGQTIKGERIRTILASGA